MINMRYGGDIGLEEIRRKKKGKIVWSEIENGEEKDKTMR